MYMPLTGVEEGNISFSRKISSSIEGRGEPSCVGEDGWSSGEEAGKGGEEAGKGDREKQVGEDTGQGGNQTGPDNTARLIT